MWLLQITPDCHRVASYNSVPAFYNAWWVVVMYMSYHYISGKCLGGKSYSPVNGPSYWWSGSTYDIPSTCIFMDWWVFNVLWNKKLSSLSIIHLECRDVRYANCLYFLIQNNRLIWSNLYCYFAKRCFLLFYILSSLISKGDSTFKI